MGSTEYYNYCSELYCSRISYVQEHDTVGGQGTVEGLFTFQDTLFDRPEHQEAHDAGQGGGGDPRNKDPTTRHPHDTTEAFDGDRKPNNGRHDRMMHDDRMIAPLFDQHYVLANLWVSRAN